MGKVILLIVILACLLSLYLLAGLDGIIAGVVDFILGLVGFFIIRKGIRR